MGIDLANKQSRMAASSENDGHSSNFNVYDIMVKAWVRDQRTLDKKCQEMEDVSSFQLLHPLLLKHGGVVMVLGGGG